MVSICLMPLPPGHPPSDLRDPPFPLRTFKFKHKHFLSCNFNEHRCFVLSWLYIATPSLHILFLFNIFLVVLNPFVKQNCNLNPPPSPRQQKSAFGRPPIPPSSAIVSICRTPSPPAAEVIYEQPLFGVPFPKGCFFFVQICNRYIFGKVRESPPTHSRERELENDTGREWEIKGL